MFTPLSVAPWRVVAALLILGTILASPRAEADSSATAGAAASDRLASDREASESFVIAANFVANPFVARAVATISSQTLKTRRCDLVTSGPASPRRERAG
jgi:hypothetical protein